MRLWLAVTVALLIAVAGASDEKVPKAQDKEVPRVPNEDVPNVSDEDMPEAHDWQLDVNLLLEAGVLIDGIGRKCGGDQSKDAVTDLENVLHATARDKSESSAMLTFLYGAMLGSNAHVQFTYMPNADCATLSQAFETVLGNTRTSMERLHEPYRDVEDSVFGFITRELRWLYNRLRGSH